MFKAKKETTILCGLALLVASFMGCGDSASANDVDEVEQGESISSSVSGDLHVMTARNPVGMIWPSLFSVATVAPSTPVKEGNRIGAFSRMLASSFWSASNRW